MLLRGPVARIAMVFTVIALFFALLDLIWQPRGWVVFLVVFLATALASAISGLRSSVYLTDDGVRVPGSAVIPWDSIDAVRVERAADLRMVCPTLDIAQGRRINNVLLDGLATRTYSERVIAQAQEIAKRASCPCQIYDDAPQHAPKRGV